MKTITNKINCCGCAACVQKCPKQCISFHEDNEGFIYPQIDATTCVDCGLCEKVCPMLNPSEARKPLQVLAAINKDEKIRMESSSGGIFTLLAEKVINEGGVVFGARFDEKWQVTLDYTETIEGLAVFRGSKYVQARTGETYKKCEQFLKDGRNVLYTGTPCQISGLKHFLRKKYDNLIAVDFLCHGAPSPKAWAIYLSEVTNTAQRAAAGKSSVSPSLDSMSSIKDIKFRDKSNGWKKFRFVLTLNEPTGEVEKSSVLSSISLINERYTDNAYMKAFLRDLILRPSCYKCAFRSGRSGSDITIADYWGIQTRHPEIDDDCGTSLVLVNSQRGKEFMPLDKMKYVESCIDNLVIFNGGLKEVTLEHPKRDSFFKGLNSTNSFLLQVDKALRPPIFSRIKSWIKKAVICIYHFIIDKKK